MIFFFFFFLDSFLYISNMEVNRMHSWKVEGEKGY